MDWLEATLDRRRYAANNGEYATRFAERYYPNIVAAGVVSITGIYALTVPFDCTGRNREGGSG